MKLSLSTLRAANIARLPQFKNSNGQFAHSAADGSDWSLADWMTALVGEVGEAANIQKKFRRGDLTESEFMVLFSSELADIQTYLDILAFRAGIDLARATIAKFNVVSVRAGSSIFIRGDEVHNDLY